MKGRVGAVVQPKLQVCSECRSEIYETEVDEEIVASVFAGRPLTDEQLKSLNPEAKLREIRAAVIETGYPVEAK